MYKIIGADQKEYGPVSADQLRQWAIEGRVNGLTRVQAAESTEWKTMAEVPEFAALFPKASLPPPLAHSTAVPITPLPLKPATSTLSVWALVVGICSILCCCGWIIVSPAAIVLGAMALSHLKSHPELTGRNYAIIGLVLGIVALLFYGVSAIVIFNNPGYMQQLKNSIPQP